MNIHQLSVHHDDRQDRLLLRLKTLDLQEWRFWLTRRMTLRLVPVIEKSAVRLETAKPGVAVPDVPSQQMLTEFKRDAFLQKADFATPFENQTTSLPLGQEPLLVTDAQLNVQANGALDITLEDKTNPDHIKTCRLQLQVNLVHGLVHLIQQAAEKAEWGAAGLATDIAASTAPPPSSSNNPPESPRYTH